MNQPPTLWRILSSLWLQNFRMRPFATVASSILFVVLLAGLLFAGAFFFIGFVVIAIVLAVVQRFFLGAPKWQQPPGSRSGSVHEETVSRTSKTTLEGDYSVITDRPNSKKDAQEQASETPTDKGQ